MISAITSSVVSVVVVMLSVVVVMLSVVVELSSSVVLSVVEVVVEEPLSLLLLQEMTVRLKRNRVKIMSICLTRFPIGGLGEPNI